MEWPKEISKFFSRQKLASISQVGFRVINIPSLGVFYKNGCCGGCLTEKNQWVLLTGDDGVGFNYYINLLSKQNLMKTVWISPRGLMDQ